MALILIQVLAKQDEGEFLPPRDYYAIFHDQDQIQFYKYTKDGKFCKVPKLLLYNFNPVYDPYGSDHRCKEVLLRFRYGIIQRFNWLT
jgi:hypothetical protein